MEQQQLTELFNRYLDNRCTLEEIEILSQHFHNENESHLRALIINELSTMEDHVKDSKLQMLADRAYQEIQNQINPSTIQRNSNKKLWATIGVAASMAVIISGLYVYNSYNTKQTTQVYTQNNDVAPGKMGATLTLANGKTIRLSEAVKGELAKESGVQISKTADGKLVYEIKGSTTGNKQNTLSTTRGETYQLRLPDGTLVWLNAASSLTYSAALKESGVRRVRLDGEAYFEVTKDKAHPFIVETRQQEVEVLGTQFNVNAYKDEGNVETTLLEGSVKVSAGENKQILKPGYQAINSGNTIKVAEVNIESITDWKNGDFYLDRIDFKSAMRKLERWYNVEMIYDASVPANIVTGGWISRNKSLSQVLKVIESSGLVHFKIEGRKVYVSK